MRRRMMGRSLPLVILAIAVGACEGPNLFTGPAAGTDGEGSDPPVVLELRAPEFVRPGGVLEVEIEALGAEGISAVDVTLVETVVRERTLVIDPPETDVDTFTEFLLPERLTLESVLVRVEVEDQLGFRSAPVEVVIPVLQDGETF